MKHTLTPLFDLQSIVTETGSGNKCWIAFSGGIDSTALLHNLVIQCDELNIPLHAIHINHNLYEISDSWSRHCEEICRFYNVEAEILNVDASTHGSSSPEEYARDLRYMKMEQLLGDNELLFLAHHREDQAETLLLQLMRGAGPEGLSGMPFKKKLGRGWMIRPLLVYSKQDLKQYNLENNLEWIEDPSNRDTRIYRNFIRHKVMPLLREKWPSAVNSIARAAENQSDYLEILDEVARMDHKVCRGTNNAELLIDKLTALSIARQKNLLRYWIRLNEHALPSSVKLHQILVEVVNARQDAMPCIQWKNTEIRRHRNRIYIMHPLPDCSDRGTIRWNLHEPLSLPYGFLIAKHTTGDGIKSSIIVDDSLDVSFRKGGEAMHATGSTNSKKLKKLYQEADIPAWLRDKIPLLYSRDNLVAVAGLWVDKKYQAKDKEPGWNVQFYN